MAMTAWDYEEIRQLLARYNLAIDSGDAAGWAARFVPDGVFECSGVPASSPFGGRHEGSAALHAYAVRHFGVAKGRARHWNATLEIEGDGREATMRCYLLALSVVRTACGSQVLAGIDARPFGELQDRLDRDPRLRRARGRRRRLMRVVGG